jgi:hypothetical protein
VISNLHACDVYNQRSVCHALKVAVPGTAGLLWHILPVVSSRIRPTVGPYDLPLTSVVSNLTPFYPLKVAVPGTFQVDCSDPTWQSYACAGGRCFL